MSIRAMGLGSPHNGAPEPGRYRWRGKPPPAAPERVERPKRAAYTPQARQKRLEALARILERTPDGVLTAEQAARTFGVTKRTIFRDLEALREAS